MNDSSTGGYIVPSSAIPVEDAALDVILQNLVVGVTGLPTNYVRPRWQQVPPVMPDVTVDWCAVGVQGIAPDDGSQSNVFDGTKTTTKECVILTILASFYGPNAILNAQNLRSGLMIPQNREALYFQDIALVERPDQIQFAPTMVNDNTQRRADVSFRLRRTLTVTWPILPIVYADVQIDTEHATETVITPSSLSPLTE